MALEGAREDLTWSIAGNMEGTNPNILSELDWSEVGSIGFRAGINHPIRKRFSGFLDFSLRRILFGTVTDTDFQSDDRTDHVFFAEEDAGKGQVFQGSAGLLVQIVQDGDLRLALGGGYGLLNQQLYLVNEHMDLNSRYANHWYGPLLAGNAGYKINEELIIGIHTTYHQVRYRATGDWNLIEGFEHPVSFRHTAKGFGLDNELYMKWQWKEHLQFLLTATHSYWTTGRGIDTLYKSDDTSVRTRLNDVTRNAIGMKIGMVFSVF